MKLRFDLPTLLVVVGLLLVGRAGAVGSAVAPEAASPAVSHASARIGDDDPVEVEVLRREHNLQLVFALKGSGEYLADVRVAIYQSPGEKILGAVSGGPFFFVSLPPGRYRIDAELNGKTLTRSLTMPAKGRRDLYFYWDSE
ncbi:carboxypeptidase regulatory-like domain-containing protein [Accumulibacter sp.]|uniref:carboxypeptidase regulatory-like domain-containing protein n=1 Tax=Accumulibacter sp. TaxID=2053492 RepID=UPI0025F0FFF7|nr:carboxypeptidase regulatory-like domain-containing protein [Accumulibacter sp.]MCM8597006.1 carboxypeptidase-like regulatory domain-containing protein [Accumulibacter sp.]MCM8626248.1 carboxypeptidase-like regulatory domain-containing protein [Accumulibacter sp.]MDS4051155.1 carboxypeptidase regulatory-like domain-containing protein [Accumulibacter sp.]